VHHEDDVGRDDKWEVEHCSSGRLELFALEEVFYGGNGLPSGLVYVGVALWVVVVRLDDVN
jgi:hypothetical protein